MTIAGSTAAEIVDSVRGLIERGGLAPGDALPPVRALADTLDVNRNTAVAAYRQLAQAGLVVSLGRAGTRVADVRRSPQEGFAPDSRLRDIGTGNPDPSRLPDIGAALAALGARPVLYGEPVIDPQLGAWASQWVQDDLLPAEVRITITSGAVDAVERLLAQALQRDDAVALEDPCFLASIHTVRLGGYRAVPVPVDERGMTVEGLRAALDEGVRAVICTPRAQNPTGASLSAERARELRAVLADHPYVLLIEDDHFSMLSTVPYESIIGPDHQRWALIRSVSKFFGPDMCLAVTAADPTTADRLSMRLSPGTTWVSHILQRLTYALATEEDALETTEHASRHYAERNTAFAARLRERGVEANAGDGLSLWVDVGVPAAAAAAGLMRRGWLARPGDEFSLTGMPSTHLRLTVHTLTDDEADTLAEDVAAVARR